MPFDAKNLPGEVPDARLNRIIHEQIALLGGFGPFQRLMCSFAELGGKKYAPRYRCPICKGLGFVAVEWSDEPVECAGCCGGGIV